MVSRRDFLKSLGVGFATLTLSDQFLNSKTLEEEVADSNNNWETTKELTGLYGAIAQDLKQGKPLIISNYLGLWIDGKPPERNLYWGAFYGHKKMFDRAKTDTHITKNFQFHNWEKVYSNSNDNDPLETVVYKMEVNPNAHWREKGILKPFTIFQVYQVYKNIYNAGTDMFKNLRHDEARKITLKDGSILDLGKDSRITGYIGHNLLMDGVINEDVERLEKITLNIKGMFAIGCVTASYFKHLTKNGEYVLLYTTSFMAPEGYNSLAFVDGIAQGMSGKDLAIHCNNAYRYFQVLGGQKKPGPLFVNHAHILYNK